MAASRRKQDDKNLEILRELITINGNKYCLDCNQRGPTYVNTTIGSFVCSKCSGMLRGLTPPHRIKSISMATFTPEEIEFIKSRGNDYCRRVWLGLYEGESIKLNDDESVRNFMCDKYEKKRYYLEPNKDNFVTTNGTHLNEKSKPKLITANPTLISISSPPAKSAINRANGKLNKNNNMFPLNTPSQKSNRIANNSEQPFDNSSFNSTFPASDFPVDFTTADIYNGSLITNNNQVSQSSAMFSNFNTPISTANDRYAALADLDLALRQQNMKNMEENNLSNKNPFQSSSNPFFNGGWNNAASVQVNPFSPQMNNGNYTNSKNPFL